MSVAEISRLRLGEGKAESELQDLEKYFITTPTYINAKNEGRRKTYYIGQRGAGKTALFKKLADDYKNDGRHVIINITPDQFSYERFNNAEHNYSDMRAVYGTVWHYTLVTEMFRGVVEFYDLHPNIRKNKDNFEKLKTFVQNRGGVAGQGFLGTFLSFFGEFTSNNAFNKALRIGSSGSHNYKEFLRLTNLSPISGEVNAFLNITDSYPVCLFVDELDRGWNNTKK